MTKAQEFAKLFDELDRNENGVDPVQFNSFWVKCESVSVDYFYAREKTSRHFYLFDDESTLCIVFSRKTRKPLRVKDMNSSSASDFYEARELIEKPTYFMHHATGEVETEEFWCEYEDFDECLNCGFLIEVTRSAEGEWVEA